MLQKGAEYIKRLGGEKSVLQKKIEALRKERDDLNNSLRFVCWSYTVRFLLKLVCSQSVTFDLTCEWSTDFTPKN